MMINRRLIGTVSDSKKYIAANVACQGVSFAANIIMMGAIAHLMQKIYEGTADNNSILTTAVVAVIAVVVRFMCSILSSRMGYLSSKTVKKTLREMIYRKLLLRTSYKEKVQTSELVQVAVEGVDQLETYFGAYLPQFFYAMLAPLTLFAVLNSISCLIYISSLSFLFTVTMIPISFVEIDGAKRSTLHIA